MIVSGESARDMVKQRLRLERLLQQSALTVRSESGQSPEDGVQNGQVNKAADGMSAAGSSHVAGSADTTEQVTHQEQCCF